MNSKEKWDNLAAQWVLTGPPASPSSQDITNYRRLIVEVLPISGKRNALILGCTPGLRDLFAQDEILISFGVTCVDISSAMYRSATKYLRRANPSEHFIESDWLTMNVGLAHFDFVIGDKIIDNVRSEEWPRFFDRIRQHLKQTGYFVTRIAPQNVSLQEYSFIQLFFKWSNQYEISGKDVSLCASAFWEELLGASAFKNGRHKTQTLNRFTRDIDNIQRNFDRLNNKQRELLSRFIELFMQSKDDIWSSYALDEILDLMSPYFSLDRMLHSSDYESGPRQPVLRMGKRL